MTSPNLFNFHSLVSLYIYTHYKRIVNFVSQSQRSLYNLTTESLPYFASNDTEPLPSAGQTFEFATSIDYVSLRSLRRISGAAPLSTIRIWFRHWNERCLPREERRKCIVGAWEAFPPPRFVFGPVHIRTRPRFNTARRTAAFDENTADPLANFAPRTKPNRFSFPSLEETPSSLRIRMLNSSLRGPNFKNRPSEWPPRRLRRMVRDANNLWVVGAWMR